MFGTMADPLTIEQEKFAQKWVDTLDAGNRWRLQVLSRRTAIDPKTGEQKDYPVKIRRFAEGCPVSHITAALNYLISKAPYTGVIFNKNRLDGSYVPTKTEWRRDNNDVQNRQGASLDGSYTIVQDLIDPDHADEFAATTGASCSSEETTEFEWDASGIPNVPEPGQGETYSIHAVSRNEDGTYNYQLVRRRAKTQHSGPTTTVDNAVQTQTEETWDNVYGEEGAYLDSEGSPISVPLAGVSGNTEVRIGVSVNNDCTYKLQVMKTVTKEVTQREHSAHTQFTGDHDIRTVGQAVPIPLAPEPADGKTFDHTSELLDNGLYANTVATKVERPVPDAVVEVRVGRRGKRVTITHTNQQTPASLEDIEVGGSVKVEKTPGFLYTNTISTWDKSEKISAAEHCTWDLYKHTGSLTVAGLSEIPMDHVPPPSYGKITSRTTEMDEEGSISQTIRTEQEQRVDAAEESWDVTLEGVVHSVTNRNVGVPGIAPEFSLGNIGRRVRNERTPGDLYSVTTSEIVSSGDLKTGDECDKSIYEHTDTSIEVITGSTAIGDHAKNAGGGHVHHRSVRVNSSGGFTVTTRDTEELTVDDYEVSHRTTTRAKITTKTVKSGTSPAKSAGLAPGESSSHRKTPGGRYDRTDVTVEAQTEIDSAHSSDDRFQSVVADVKLAKGSVDSTPVTAGSGGIVKTCDVDRDEYGIVKTVTRTTTEKAANQAAVSYRRVTKGLIKTVVDRNVKTTATDPGSSKPGHSSSHQMTPGGLYDLTTVTVEASSKKDSAHNSQDAFSTVVDTVKLTTGEVDETLVDGGTNGESATKTSTLDEYGFVTTITRKTSEKEVSDAEVSYRRITKGLIKTVTVRSGTQQASDPGSSAPGCSSSHQKTPGGLYNLTTVTVEASAKQDSARSEQDAFSTTKDEVVITTGDVDNDLVDGGADGKFASKSSTLDEYGFVTTVTRETTEKTVQDYEVSYRRTTRGLVKSTTTRAGTTPANDPGENKVGYSESHQITPGGKYNLTKTELTATTKIDRAYHGKTVFEKVDDEVTFDTGKVDDTEPDDAGHGYHYVKTSDLDEYGFARTTVRKTFEKDYADQAVVVDADYFTKTVTKTHKNKTLGPVNEIEHISDGAGEIKTRSRSVNPGGTMDFVEKSETAKYRYWEDEVDVNYEYVYVIKFRNASDAGRTECLNKAKAKYEAKVTDAQDGRMPSSHSISPSSDRNRFGLFDGQYTVHCSWHPESAGQKNALNAKYMWLEYDAISESYSPRVNEDGSEATVVKTKVTDHVYYEVGRGLNNFHAVTAGKLNVKSISASYDHITGRYSASVVTFTKYEVESETQSL